MLTHKWEMALGASTMFFYSPDKKAIESYVRDGLYCHTCTLAYKPRHT